MNIQTKPFIPGLWSRPISKDGHYKKEVYYRENVELGIVETSTVAAALSDLLALKSAQERLFG